MKSNFIIFFSLLLMSFFTIACSEDESSEEQEGKENLSELRTANDTKYLTQEEKDIFFYLNYARQYPKEFSKKFVVPYTMDASIIKPHAYDERKASLEKELETMEAVGLIYPDDYMYELANCFATQAGQAGIVGHSRAGTSCVDPMTLGITWGENISYGYNSALDIVIQLLIDGGEGNESLGHRKNNLSPHFNRLGVSIKTHKIYRHNAVMNFTRK